MSVEVILNLYADLVLVFGGIFAFQAWLTFLNYRKHRKKKLKYLFWLTVLSALLCLWLYVVGSFGFLGSVMLMSLSAPLLHMGSLYFYIKTTTSFLGISHLRSLRLVESVILINISLVVLSILMQAVFHWNPLLAPEPIVTNNIWHLKMQSLLPRPPLVVVAVTNTICLAFIVYVLLRALLKPPILYPSLVVGVVVTVVTNITDMLMMHPMASYLVPLGFLSYFVEIVRITLYYHKEANQQIKTLRIKLDHTSKEVVTVRDLLNQENAKSEKLYSHLVTQSKMMHFAAVASSLVHDLRSPVHVINYIYDTYLDDDPAIPETIKPRFTSALKNIKRTLDSSRNLLGEPGEVKWVSYSLNDIMNHVYQLNKTSIISEGIRLNHRLECDVDGVFSPDHVFVMVQNLLSNAREAILMKRQKQAVGQEFITMSAKRLGDVFQIEVEDNGLGIQDQHREKIFEVAFSTKTSMPGYGLGLSIVQGAVNIHGGSLNLISQYLQGTKFSVTIPIRPQPLA